MTRSVSSSSDEDIEVDEQMGFDGKFSPTRSRIYDNQDFETASNYVILNGEKLT